MFSYHPKKNFCFLITFMLLSANALNLEKSKILSCGKELNTGALIPPKRLVKRNVFEVFNDKVDQRYQGSRLVLTNSAGK